MSVDTLARPTTLANSRYSNPESDPQVAVAKLFVSHVTFRYGSSIALKNVSMPFYERKVTALMGPSGCGKSTLLRVCNRLHDMYPDQHIDGEIFLDGKNILAPGVDVNKLRLRIGMVFQKPTPFPMSIYNNVAFGPRIYGKPPAAELNVQVEIALRRAALWDEVKVILLDEPCSSLDPRSTALIEETISELKTDHTIVIVTHNLKQAARISDFTAFMYLGSIEEWDITTQIFTAPRNEHTQHYVSGRFG